MISDLDCLVLEVLLAALVTQDLPVSLGVMAMLASRVHRVRLESGFELHSRF